MPALPPLDLDRLAPEVLPGLRLMAIVHDRLELAGTVRAALEAYDPMAVAVELPLSLAQTADRAIERLPRISVVISEAPGEEALVWPVVPGDPFVEALRWAQEHDRRAVFFDPDLRYGERHREPVPDPYAIWSLGAETYLEGLRRAAAQAPASPADELREAGMAHHLLAARDELSGGRLLALVGAAHYRRLCDGLGSPQALPFARPRRPRVELRHLHPESLTALLPDPPLAHAVYELLRRGELPPEPPVEATAARRLSLLRGGLTLVQRQPERWDGERSKRVVELAAHRSRRLGPGGRHLPDRWALARAVWDVAARSYHEQTQETVAVWQRRLFLDFAYRYARTLGLLVPSLYEWVVAARGVADDNLAWEVFEAARAYPWQEELASDLATALIDGSQLDLGTRKVRFRRRFFRVKQRPVPLPVRQRPPGDDPRRWLEGFQGGGLCSFPPEDLVVEDYGRFLRHKAVSLLSAERTRSEPFSGSFLDGVDLRETLRHLEDSRVWVREMGRAPGKAGSVVVIFDRDLDAERYPYLMTWLGEHGEESDMAFYSTHPAEQVVGPGIMRATYGGFLMTVPPGRLFDIWQDPDYRPSREKSEVLLRAGIDYSEEKLVVHVAQEPPSERLYRYAAAQAKRIVHLPLGSLSPVTLKRIRVLHILVGHDKRKIARDYIW